MTIRDDEAKLIRDAATRLIQAESVYSILADWYERGIRTTPGKRWTTTAFRRLMTSPRVVGKRQHHDATYPAAWDAILDEPTWRRVRDVFANKEGRRHHGPPVRYLLVGVVRCGRPDCGAKLVSRLGGRPGNVRSYGCPPPRWRDGCGHTSIVAEPLEDHVTKLALELLDNDAVCRALLQVGATDDQATTLFDQERELEAALVQLADDYADGTFTKPEYLRQKARKKAQLAQVQAQRARLTPRRAFLPLGQTPIGAWLDGSVEVRRSLLRMVIADIVIKPPRRRGMTTFDPDRVEVIPQEELLSDATTRRIVNAVLRAR